MTGRARAIAMAGTSLACAGVAVSAVQRERDEVRAQVGDLAPVVVAGGELRAGMRVTPARARDDLLLRRVPARFVPGGALRDPDEAVGLRLAVSLAAGDYVTRGHLRAVRRGGSGGAPPTRGRLVEVPVAGAATIAEVLRPGATVDVLVTTAAGAGPARTYLALQRVTLVAFDAGGKDSGSDDGRASGTATLRVTLRQAIFLTAAQSFAREVRLVPRPAGDRRTVRPAQVSAAEVGG
jgi:pilus assembly protein CpaB